MKTDPLVTRADFLLRRDGVIQEGHFVINANNGKTLHGVTFIDFGKSFSCPYSVNWFANALLRKIGFTPDIVVGVEGDYTEPSSGYGSILAFASAAIVEAKVGECRVRFYTTDNEDEFVELFSREDSLIPDDSKIMLVSDLIKSETMLKYMNTIRSLCKEVVGASVIQVPAVGMPSGKQVISLLNMNYDWLEGSSCPELDNIPITAEYDFRMDFPK